MSKVKRAVNHYCQECKRIIEGKVVELEVRGKKWKLCEDCVQQVEEEEEYQDLLLCYICCKPVREENMMSLKNGGLIHEGCYEGGDG